MFVWPFLFKGMGGRVRPYGLPWTIFVPTQTLSHPKLPMGGVKENSPAGIAIPTIPSESELLPEWTKLKLISGPRGHLGSKQTLNPRPKRSKKAKGSIIRICKGFSDFTWHRISEFSACQIFMLEQCRIRLPVVLSLGFLCLMFVLWF